MRLVELGQFRAHQLAFLLVARPRQHAAHHLEAREHQISVGHVGLAIIADLVQPALLVGLPHLAAVHAQLAGKADQLGQLVQRRVGRARYTSPAGPSGRDGANGNG